MLFNGNFDYNFHYGKIMFFIKEILFILFKFTRTVQCRKVK